MFIALGLSALFPVIHGVMKFGIRQMNKQIGLFWVVLQGSLYIVGACIYAVSQKTVSYDPASNMHILRSKYRSVYILVCSTSG